MGREIERKFLVDRNLWKPAGAGVPIRQAYLSAAKERVVRVRIAGPQAFLTIKGPTDEEVTRMEFEYSIPVEDATILIERICERPVLEKTRYEERIGDHVWEIDVFHGDNDGLLVAEIELDDAADSFERPAWIREEVSEDPRYLNANLIARPFKSWRE